jgi:hypothetical protein
MVFSTGVTAGQPDVILPLRMTSAAEEAGAGHRAGHISDAAGEAESRRGWRCAGCGNRAADGAPACGGSVRPRYRYMRQSMISDGRGTCGLSTLETLAERPYKPPDIVNGISFIKQQSQE